MKINAITISGFRSHLDTSIKDLGRLVLILGPNASGKSGIMDAIAYAFTGACRGTDEGGRGYDTLASPGCKGAPVIILETDRGLINRTVGTGPKSQTQEKINGIVQCDRQALRCAVRSQAFLDLEPKEQEALLRALTSNVVTVEQIRQTWSGMEGISMASLTSMDGVLQAYQVAYGARAALKKSLAAASSEQAVEPAPVEWLGREAKAMDRDELNAAIAGSRQAIADMDAAKAQADKMEWLKGKKDALEKHLDDLRSRIAPFPSRPELEAKIAKLKEGADEEARQLDARRDMAASWNAKRKLAMESIEASRSKINRLQSIGRHGGECPHCGQGIDEYRAKKMADSLNESIAEQEKVAEAAAKSVDQLSQNPLLDGKVKREYEQAKAALSEMASIRADAKATKAELADVVSKLGQAPEFVPEKYAAMVQVHHRLMAHDSYRVACRNIAQRRESAAKAVEDAELAVKMLGPGGAVRELHMGSGLDQVLSMVSEISKSIMVGDVEVKTSPTFSVQVNGRPASMLSASERWRTSLAFSVAIARKTGVNFICLDGADILDDERRGDLIGLVEGLGTDQVIISATSTSENFEAEGWTPVYLSNSGGRTVARQ